MENNYTTCSEETKPLTFEELKRTFKELEKAREEIADYMLEIFPGKFAFYTVPKEKRYLQYRFPLYSIVATTASIEWLKKNLEKEESYRNLPEMLRIGGMLGYKVFELQDTTEIFRFFYELGGIPNTLPFSR